MKNILTLTTAQDLTDWGDYFLKVTDIDPDPATGLDRVAIVRNLHIDPESTSVMINTVVYIVDSNGDPLNGRMNPAHKNTIPVEVAVTATNKSYISLSTFEVITDLTGLTHGVDYMEEFEAYRLQAKGGPINLFSLMTFAIQTSTKI